MKNIKTTCDEPPHSYHAGATISRIVCGLAIIVAAIVVLLNSFGVIDTGINTGLLVALAALATVGIASLFHLFWAGFFFMAATIITIMNANDLVFSLDGQAIGGLFIAAGLLTIAFHIIFHVHRKKLWKHSSCADANFGSATKHFEGDFDRAHLECNFGSIKAYFDKATLTGDKGTLDIECNFGGVELFIPKDWKLKDNTSSSFSGTVEKNHATTTKDSPTLTLTGEANFGGITITYI